LEGTVVDARMMVLRCKRRTLDLVGALPFALADPPPSEDDWCVKRALGRTLSVRLKVPGSLNHDEVQLAKTTSEDH
jgi:hypothetical protein